MQLTERVHLAGNEALGFGLSRDLGCNVYIVDGRSELVLIDARVGFETELLK